MRDFILYSEKKPEKEGVYLWYKKTENDIFITFKSKMRLRNSGTILSPDFDHWNGYKVLVPKDVMWREVKEDDDEINIIGCDLKCCPTCGGKPEVDFLNTFVTSRPIDANRFKISCCIMNTDYISLVDAINIWNKRYEQ